MSMTTQTLGLTQQRVLLKAYYVANEKVPRTYEKVLGRTLSTNQATETIRQFKALGPAEQTPEGEDVRFDDLSPLFQKTAKPVLYTKGLRMTELTEFTAQYGIVKDRQPMFARSFGQQRNRVGFNLFNLGFTSTNMGVNNETLFGVHSMGNVTFRNRPLVDIPLSPLGLEQGLTELNSQVDATGMPQPVDGKVYLVVPRALKYLALRITQPDRLAGTNNNDSNPAGNEVEVVVSDWLTSPTAWFLVSANEMDHGLYWLNQLPYRIDQLPLDKALFYAWVARESYDVGWYDAHGVWGTAGA